jgi:hypothetical protein
MFFRRRSKRSKMVGRCDVEDSNLGDWYPMEKQVSKAP